MVKPPSPDPVPAIAEADAIGDTAALFADIRATLGVPVVNLIWRHLATIPEALPWAWSTLKPHYASGVIANAADTLSAMASTCRPASPTPRPSAHRRFGQPASPRQTSSASP